MTLSQPIVLFIAASLIVVLLGWVLVLELRLRKLLSGKKAKSLETIIMETHERMGEFDEHKELVRKEIERINSGLRKSVQSVHTIRFNPFSNTGSNQSFSTAIVNGEGNGVVISSLNARGTVSVYAKPIKNFRSEYELSDEERAALAQSTEA